MEYKFINVQEDNYMLEYKTSDNNKKTIEFKSDIEVIKEFQSVNVIARTKLMKDLTAQGITKKDLTIIRKENGKTYYDNTNFLDLEEEYTKNATVDIIDKITKIKLGMSYLDLLKDIGIENGSDVEQFTADLLNCLQGKKEAVDSKPSE